MATKRFKHPEARLEQEFQRVYSLLSDLEPASGAAAPANPPLGKRWYDTGASKWKTWDGSAWKTDTN